MPSIDRPQTHTTAFRHSGNSGRAAWLRLLLLSLLPVIVGCGGDTNDQRGTRVAGIGLVTMNDKPLPTGRIVFFTDQGNGQVKSSALIRDGSFTFTEKNGPLEGRARVEIHAVPMELEDFEAQRAAHPEQQVPITRCAIPACYNIQSELTATVSAESGIQPLAFQLTSQD